MSFVCGRPLPRDVASTKGSAIARRRVVLNFMRSSPDKRTRVLFINSALQAGADTWIHFLLLRDLSQGQFAFKVMEGACISPQPCSDTRGVLSS
jgi:hypothetical protein